MYNFSHSRSSVLYGGPVFDSNLFDCVHFFMYRRAIIGLKSWSQVFMARDFCYKRFIFLWVLFFDGALSSKLLLENGHINQEFQDQPYLVVGKLPNMKIILLNHSIGVVKKFFGWGLLFLEFHILRVFSAHCNTRNLSIYFLRLHLIKTCRHYPPPHWWMLYILLCSEPVVSFANQECLGARPIRKSHSWGQWLRPGCLTTH